MNGGRFDFDDGGTYCGGWEEGKAHGHGICTGPDSQGEYAGAWHYGFEVSGIYIWPSGSSYSGQWQNGKRHGLGVEQRGRWIYKGEWTQGFKGRYGRREALNSGAHYLGTWSSGLHDGYGTEVYADGGSYKGQWLRGMRHGYGIRTSAAFESASKRRSRLNTHASLTSLRSTFDEENGADTGISHANREKKAAEKPDMRGGFVLRACSSGPSRRRRSLSERSLAVKRTILSNLRIKKQHSTGDIHQRVTSTAGSLRSSGSTISCTSDESDHHRHVHELDAMEEKIDGNAVETYKGEWKNDARSGYGICDRSDGLRYVGEWLDNKKHGYGVTCFKDGTKEEGRYKNNILVCSMRRRGLFFVRMTKMREHVETSVETAKRAAEIAAQRVDIALSRTATAQERADHSVLAAERAKDDSETARIHCAELNPSFRQPGIDHLRQNRGVRSILQSNVYANHVSFESTNSAVPPSSLPPHMHAQKQQSQPSQYQFALPPTGQTGGSQFFGPNMPKPIGNNVASMEFHLPPNAQQTPLGNADGTFGGQKLPPNAQQHGNLETASTSDEMFNLGQHERKNPNGGQYVSPNVSSAQSYPNDDTVSRATNPPSSYAEAAPSTSKAVGNSTAAGRPTDSGGGANLTAAPPAGSRLAAQRIGRNRPERMSTMSLSDDHFDQYTMKKASTVGADVTGRTILEEIGASSSVVGAELRRNRPSLIRQTEVNEAANLNRRSTLASARDRIIAPTDDSNLRAIQQREGQHSDNADRNSLPNLDELIAQDIYLKREEAARLASERRQETQRLLEEEERLHNNPLRYLYHPVLRNWLVTWKWPIFLVVLNVLLFYYLMHLLAAEVKSDSKEKLN